MIFVEQEQSDNIHTILGSILHRKVVLSEVSQQKEDWIARAVWLKSERLGVHGIADTIEYTNGRYYPVEYKKSGISKKCEHFQVCLQAMCLEEMLKVDIPFGFIFHGKTKRREEVLFTPQLRAKVETLIVEVRQLFQQNLAPKAHQLSACKGCNVQKICLPNIGQISVDDWLQKHIEKLL